MHSRLLKFAIIAILLAVLCYPLVESLDTWDGVGPTNDTELTIFVLAIGVGFILALRLLIVRSTPAMNSTAVCLDSPEDSEPGAVPRLLAAFSESALPQVLPLRI